MAIKNFYALLGISSTATQEEIKIAYRKLAKRFHPDKNPGNKQIEERFKEITEAYNILGDEDNRKKYDLKFFYSSNAQAGERYNAGVKREAPRFKVKKERPPTAAEIRSTRIIFGIVIAFVLFVITMIILHPEDDEATKFQTLLSNINKDDEHPVKEKDPPVIMDADSPYDKIFGEGESVFEARNTITVTNSEASEVVICLVEKGKNGRTIRNEYFGPGLTYKIVGIPNGIYYIKAYFGKHWDPEKVMDNGKVKGGFTEEIGFYRSDKKSNLFTIDQHKSGENLVYSNYEVDLRVIMNDSSRKISAEEFFGDPSLQGK